MLDLLLELEERGYDLSEMNVDLQPGNFTASWSGEYQVNKVGGYSNLYLER
jgi:hypothetical protein